MSRRPVLVAVWTAGTVVATAFAYVAVHLVLAGVSGHGAERLRYGRVVAISRSAGLIPPATAQRHRLGSSAPTTARSSRTTRTTTPSATPSGEPGGASPGGGTEDHTVTPTTSRPAGGSGETSGDPGGSHSGPGPSSGGGDGGGGSGGGSGSGDHTTTTIPSAPTTATFAGSGGTATVSCSGSTIRLVSASPAYGYTMQVEESGPEKVSVTFRSRTDDTSVEASCVGGRPQLSGD